MDVKLFDSELKVMEVLWERGETICQGHCFRTVRAYWVEQKHNVYRYQKCIEKGCSSAGGTRIHVQPACHEGRSSAK